MPAEVLAAAAVVMAFALRAWHWLCHRRREFVRALTMLEAERTARENCRPLANVTLVRDDGRDGQ